MPAAARAASVAAAFDDGYRLRAATGSLRLSGRPTSASAMTSDPGYPYAQVYAPAGETFVALEPMTAPIDALGTGTDADGRAGTELHRRSASPSPDLLLIVPGGACRLAPTSIPEQP